MANSDDRVENDGSGEQGAASSVLSALTSKELLVPAALSAAGAVAAGKAPDLIRRLGAATERQGNKSAQDVGEAVAGGAKQSLGKGGIASKMLAKALPGGSDDDGEKKTRRLPIERWIDVAVPVATAYDAWSDFDEFPKFMYRVRDVRQKDRDEVTWQEKIWFSTRQWEGEITDRRENDRIAWKTTSGSSHRGVVSFHELAPHLTRVMVTMEFEPTGMVERMASGLRFVNRAVDSDLARFKAYVEMEDAEGIEYRPDNSDNSDNDRRERAQARQERRATTRA